MSLLFVSKNGCFATLNGILDTQKDTNSHCMRVAASLMPASAVSQDRDIGGTGAPAPFNIQSQLVM